MKQVCPKVGRQRQACRLHNTCQVSFEELVTCDFERLVRLLGPYFALQPASVVGKPLFNLATSP